MDSGRYNNYEARRAREEARRIAQEFGDPNRGQEYRDPYSAFATRADVFSSRKSSSNGEERNQSSS